MGLNGRRATGGQCGAASVGLGARQAAQTERSGVQRLTGPDQLSDDGVFSLSNEFLESLFSCVISKMSLIANLPKNPSLFPV